MQSTSEVKESFRLLVFASLLTLALWFIPYAGVITWPVRQFVTLLHEAGHAVAVLATFGQVHRIALDWNGSGVTLGREPTNTIALGNDTTVSRRHAAIRSESGEYVVSDEGSSNGVYVNGVKINGSQPLRPGDEIQIGNTRFRFEV